MEEVDQNITMDEVAESIEATIHDEQDMTDVTESVEDELASEVQALQEIYPTFDMAKFMADDVFRGLVTGEVKPTLRQVYEMLNPEVLVEEKIQAGVEESLAMAVDAAVTEAVERAEKNLLSHIKARGMRPPENGRNASLGVRTHPAVHRLTKDDRAKLALMAQRGETVQL